MNRISCFSTHLISNKTSTQHEEVLYSIVNSGKTAVLTLNRPNRGNAYTNEMLAQLMDCLEKANNDMEINTIVITGAGEKAFCVGFDKELLSKIDGAPQSSRRDVSQTLLLQGSKPIICSINGACAGLGLVTALMADVRFCVEHCKFTTAFAKRGLIAEHGISYVLPRIVGTSRALDLLLSSRVVLSNEALQMGLVNQVYPTPKLCLEAALKYANDINTLCSPAAMAEMRQQVYSSWNSTSQEDYNNALQLMVKSFQHPDSAEGIASLVENRKPNFQGLKAGFIRNK
jgi:enoyl-CoA hydratase/carnithine racemase